MISDANELRDQLVTALRELVDETDRVYLSFGTKFPRLLSEMDRSLAANERTIRSVVERTMKEGSHSIRRHVEETQGVIGEAASEFARMRERDTALFQELEESVQQLSELDKRIGSIKEDSIEMEIISINAMTVALKAGSPGRAFSYITEELKGVSSRTIELSDAISRHAERMQQVFDDFRTLVRRTEESEEEFATDLHTRLQTGFDEIQAGISRVEEKLRSLKARSGDVKQPLTRIMEEVQLQDVIKQSVDHVIVSLEELQHVEDTAGDEAHLDELSFFRTIPGLCDKILEEVRARLTQSIRTFREQLQTAQRFMQETEEERTQFVASLLGNGGSGESISAYFADTSELLDEVRARLQRSLASKNDIAARSRTLMEEVRLVEDHIRTFSTIVTRFKSIDIHSRIEVAKQSVLQNMHGTVDQMNALTAKIETDVNESLSHIGDFIGRISSTIQEYEDRRDEEERLVRKYGRQVRRKKRAISEAQNLLEGVVKEYSAFSSDFRALFENVKSGDAKLNQLVATIDSLRELLETIRVRAEEQRTQILRRKGLSDWTVGNERMRKIIERFTIFTHEQVAGELGGFHVGTGAQAGEVTLFE